MFRENNIEYEKVNYFTDPLTKAKVRELLRKMGVEPFEVIRKNEAAVKEFGLTPETPADEIIARIVENPAILQRPIVEVGDDAILARPIEKALDLIKYAEQ